MTVDTSYAPRARKEGSFFDTSRTLRFFIVFLASAGLFLFVHFQEIRVPILELGSVAAKYIVAEVPFTFVDEEATAAAQQAAVIDIGKIYAIEQGDVLKRRADFENSLIYDQSWRVLAPQSTFDEMCRACDKLERELLEIRFSDSRTIQRMQQAGINTSRFQEIVPIDPRQGICFTEKMWEFIRKRAFSERSFQPTTIDFLFSYLRDKIWLLRTDASLARKVRKVLTQNVPSRYVTVPVGTRIIDSGERVTPRHAAMLQAMKKALAEQRNLWHPYTIAGSLLLTCVIITTGILFFRGYHSHIVTSNRSSFLVVMLFLVGLGAAKACEIFLLRTPQSLVDLVHYPLLTPFVGILSCILVNSSVAIFFTAILSMLFTVCLALNVEGFLLTNMLVALVSIFYTKTLRRRAEILGICLKGWFTASVLITALYLYNSVQPGISIVTDIVSSGVFMMVTAVIVVGLLPLFEASFRVLTDINLMEYMNPNSELLRRLMVEAPGTYQHSLLLGSIAEAAAQAIGGNGLFCRVATLYHDIGKVAVAQYFTENQQSGMNIHQLLTPVESSKVIISHVNEGVMLARRAGLPEPFIDIIREHHGTSLVYYFYHKQLESVGHDTTLVDERDFRYTGPKPRTKEAVIVMIADSFEAACRSIDEINEEILTRLIDQIVREKIEDGQLDECLLSFEELKIIKRAMVKCLLSIGHFRIKYPAKINLKPVPS
jgi:putative nucleotidyltransferase with HDIG domain